MFGRAIRSISQSRLAFWKRSFLAMILNRGCRAGHRGISQTLVETLHQPLFSAMAQTTRLVFTPLASKKSCTINWSTLRCAAAPTVTKR